MEQEWSETGVREAVRAYASGKRWRATLEASSIQLEFGWLGEGQLERLTEEREETPKRGQGRVDLSKYRTYSGELDDYVMPPPDFSARRRSVVTVVREGSVRTEGCTCSNGKVQCSPCAGSGEVPCTRQVGCTACADNTPCTECDGDGERARQIRKDRRRNPSAAAGGPQDRRQQDQTKRATCIRCGTAEAACPSCQGRGDAPCPKCRGTGVRPCRPCDGNGSVKHDLCGGKGSFTKWTQGTITREITEQSTGLEGDLPNLVPGKVTEGSWEEFPLTPAQGKYRDGRSDDGMDVTAVLASLPGQLPSRLRAPLTGLLHRHPGELLRRGRLRRIQVARATSVLDPNHVYFAYPALTGGISVYDVLSPSFRRKVAGVAGLVGVAVILVVLVASLL